MEQLLKNIIEEWWKRELPQIKKREISLENFYSNEVKKVVVITGFRRSGKTYLLFDFVRKIGKNKCIYINFEDERIPERTEVLTNLTSILKKYSNRIKFLLLDEIQNIPLWSKWLRRMIDTENYQIFITGSSSKLSSNEIPTELRGRAISVSLFPLSFKEFLDFKNVKNTDTEKIEELIKEYIEFGAFPEIVLSEKGKKFFIIEDYYNTFLTRDIIERHNVKQKEVFNILIQILLNSTYFSISKLANNLKGIGYRVGKGTLANYIRYLKEALFIYPVEIFTPSIKKSLQCPRKVYFIDNFFIKRFSSKFSENYGRLMENIIAIELFKNVSSNPALKIFYWKDYYGKEIDFVVMENLVVKELIGISFISNEMDIEEREIDSMVKGSKIFKTDNIKLITWKLECEKNINGKKIKFIPLWKFLLYGKDMQ